MAHKFVAFGQDAAGGMTTRPSSEHSVVLRRSVLLTVESYLSSVSDLSASLLLQEDYIQSPRAKSTPLVRINKNMIQ